MDIVLFFNKYLLDFYYIPSIVLGIWDTLVSPKYKGPHFHGVHTVMVVYIPAAANTNYQIVSFKEQKKKRTEIYFLMVLETRSLNSVSPDWNQGACKTSFPLKLCRRIATCFFHLSVATGILWLVPSSVHSLPLWSHCLISSLC